MKKLLVSILFAISVIFAGSADAQVTVTASNQQGWSSMGPVADTRPGGVLNFVYDSTSPAPFGALQLTTDSSTTSKAQYMHKANVPLREITQLSYHTKYVAGPIHAGASYQLPVLLCGTSGFTTFVFEPYQNGTVSQTEWQYWDVDAGQMWSSRTVSCGTSGVVAGGGGAPFYNLAGLKSLFPNAVVVGYGVNIGSNNPGYAVRTDLFNFNGTAYDFELYDASDCKNGGWMTLLQEDLQGFENQGQCVSYVNSKTGGI